MNQYLQSKQGEFQKTIDFFKKDISNLRTGRANPAMLDNVQIEAYGTKQPINTLASITVSDAKSMVVAPWDRNVLKDVEKSIIEAELGVGVVNEGGKIRITIPQMTEENRRDLVKKLNEKMEAARITARQTRDEVKEAIEEADKNKEISEDDKFRFLGELDEEVKKRNDEIKAIRDKKEEEIMTI